MGVGMPGEASGTATAAGASRDAAAPEEEDANDEEEESLVHHAASVGDAEVNLLFCFVLLYVPVGSELVFYWTASRILAQHLDYWLIVVEFQVVIDQKIQVLYTAFELLQN